MIFGSRRRYPLKPGLGGTCHPVLRIEAERGDAAEQERGRSQAHILRARRSQSCPPWANDHQMGPRPRDHRHQRHSDHGIHAQPSFDRRIDGGPMPASSSSRTEPALAGRLDGPRQNQRPEPLVPLGRSRNPRPSPALAESIDQGVSLREDTTRIRRPGACRAARRTAQIELVLPPVIRCRASALSSSRSECSEPMRSTYCDPWRSECKTLLTMS